MIRRVVTACLFAVVGIGLAGVVFVLSRSGNLDGAIQTMPDTVADSPPEEANPLPGFRLSDTAPMRNIPREPLILPVQDAASDDTTGSRFLPANADLPIARFGSPDLQRLRFVSDRLIQPDGRVMLRLPSRRVDFAYQRVLDRQGDTVVDATAAGLVTDGEAPVYSVLTVRATADRQHLFKDSVFLIEDVTTLSETLQSEGLSVADSAEITARLAAPRPGARLFMRRTPGLEVVSTPFAVAVGIESGPDRVDAVVRDDLTAPWRPAPGASDWMIPAINRADPYANEASGPTYSQTYSLLDTLYAAGIRNGLETQTVNALLGMLSEVVDLDDDTPSDAFLTLLYNDTLGQVQRITALAYIGIESERLSFSCYVVEIELQRVECHSPRAGPVLLGNAVLAIPVVGFLTSRFGPRTHPITGEVGRLHAGVDWAAAPGSPVYAAANGVFASVGVAGGYGNMVTLRHPEGYTTRYAHLIDFAETATVGAEVRRGEVVGFVGSTGASTGPHLHFEVRLNGAPLDPLPFVTGGDDMPDSSVLAATAPRSIAPEVRAFVEVVDEMLAMAED
jgi:murein DD-endopeptidase MepM/ murein hydrolase activator NlpD